MRKQNKIVYRKINLEREQIEHFSQTKLRDNLLKCFDLAIEMTANDNLGREFIPVCCTKILSNGKYHTVPMVINSAYLNA